MGKGLVPSVKKPFEKACLDPWAPVINILDLAHVSQLEPIKHAAKEIAVSAHKLARLHHTSLQQPNWTFHDAKAVNAHRKLFDSRHRWTYFSH